MSDRGELVMIRTAEGDEEPARLYAVPLRLVPYLETLADSGVFSDGVEGVLQSLIARGIERYAGTPMLDGETLERKRRELRARKGAALW